MSSLGIIFVSFLKENIPKNENVRSKGSEREVLEMSVSQAADTMPKIVFLKLCVTCDQYCQVQVFQVSS